MAPPPKPPVICYDLQTNTNARRAPCSRYRVSASGTSLRSKVTFIPTEEDDLKQLKTDTCWHHSYEHEADDEYENSHRTSIRHRAAQRRSHEPKREAPLKQHLNYQSANIDNRKNRISSLGSTVDSQRETHIRRQQQVRHEYDQKLKERLRQKERLEQRKRQEEALRAELDAITIKLESVKKVHENLEHTYGMSHNAARYFQKTDEDYANLKQKLDQFAQIRSRDAQRQIQQRRQLLRFQQQEDREVELRRLRDVTRLAHGRHKLTSTLNGSLSSSPRTPSSGAVSSRNSPSSTISASTCSSPLSSTEELFQHNSSGHSSKSIVDTNHRNKCPVSSSTPSTSKTHNRYHSSILRTQPKRPPIEFSFFKGPPQDEKDILEVTDLNFLEKVEDKTMLEVNELLNKMQSVLGESYDERHLYSEAGNISQLRSQLDNLAIQTPDIADFCNQSYF